MAMDLPGSKTNKTIKSVLKIYIANNLIMAHFGLFNNNK